jgi:hypothetical protein
MARVTLLDIAKANGSDKVTGLIDETTKAYPEVRNVDARTIKGLNYKTLVRVTLPTVGFRAANEGTTATKGVYDNRLVETFIMNPRIEADKAVADAYEDGAAAWLAIEGSGVLTAAFGTLAKQFYYGATNGGDSKGHPGLIDAYDATNMVVDAGGTTATTGSSVWAVKYGPTFVQWVYGLNGQLELTDPREETLYDASNNPFDGYVQSMLARPGVQIGNINCVGRIKKLTADSGKGLTDALIGSLLAKFPVGYTPDVLFMTKRSQEQLRTSRTATNTTGAPAPTPMDAFGIPIQVTDGILNTESLTL